MNGWLTENGVPLSGNTRAVVGQERCRTRTKGGQVQVKRVSSMDNEDMG